MLSVCMSAIAAQESKDKLQSIYDAYRHAMAHTAMAILHNHHDAEDAVQQAFLSIAQLVHTLGDPEDPRTRSYVLITAEHKAIDILRRRRPELPLDEALCGGISIPMPCEDALSTALARLPARYRELLLLRFDVGLSAREIAKLMGLTRSNVQKLLYRAKQLLRQELEKEDITV